MITDAVGIALVSKTPTGTTNLFGPIEEVAGKSLLVLERNDTGDCLCLFSGARGQNLVDVAACDVERFVGRTNLERVSVVKPRL